MIFVLTYVSNSIIPILFFLILIYGWKQKKDMYQEFIKGVKEGFSIVFEIAPTLVGLFLAIEMMRASGLLQFILNISEPVGKIFHIPLEVIPVIITKLFSSSAATGMLLDIFKEYGPDSEAGFLAALILSSTETVFYTMSVYFNYIEIKKTRWTLIGALVSMAAGIMTSILITRIIFL
jgi:spore maturation protein B